MLLKIAASAVVVAGINGVARVNPQLGGWIAALPVVSLLSILWLLSDGGTAADVGAFVSRVLLGLMPTAALLGIIAAVLAQGFSVTMALGCAGLAWALLTLAACRLGLLGA